jgi:predicted metal-binding membrane protein
VTLVFNIRECQIEGIDAGPCTALGTLGWFLGVWVVMMAAMMFPSVAPAIALYARVTRQRSSQLPLRFAAWYLLTWAAAGVIAAHPRAGQGERPSASGVEHPVGTAPQHR